MSEDWYIAIERVESAADDLHKTLEGVVDDLREARSKHQAGIGEVDIVKGLVDRSGRASRLAPTVAFHDFERAVTDYRASMIRTLVDEELMSFTQVGELAGVSRQMIARLYFSVEDKDIEDKDVEDKDSVKEAEGGRGEG